jgi:excisionase family DNA binding protein
MPKDDQVLTVKEVATLLKVSIVTVRRWLRQGKFPVLKVGRAYRIRTKDIEAAFTPKNRHETK